MLFALGVWVGVAVVTILFNFYIANDKRDWWVSCQQGLKAIPKDQKPSDREWYEREILVTAEDYIALREYRWKLLIWPVMVLWALLKRVGRVFRWFYRKIAGTQEARANRAIEYQIMKEQALKGKL